jgi:hypothetical protein
MQTIKTYTARTNLGKSMPDSLAKAITVETHSKHFHALDTCDVWTADGWLVTAVQDDNITHHLRQADKVIVATLSLDTVLRYNPTRKSKLFGF